MKTAAELANFMLRWQERKLEDLPERITEFGGQSQQTWLDRAQEILDFIRESGLGNPISENSFICPVCGDEIATFKEPI